MIKHYCDICGDPASGKQQDAQWSIVVNGDAPRNNTYFDAKIIYHSGSAYADICPECSAYIGDQLGKLINTLKIMKGD